MFWGMGNHLGLFSEPQDWPEDQEWDVAAVGGWGPLQGGKFSG